MSPELAAEGYFNSGIAERGEAANGPRPSKQCIFQFLFSSFQFPVSIFYVPKQDYFGA
jgi:hypothetical protein